MKRELFEQFTSSLDTEEDVICQTDLARIYSYRNKSTNTEMRVAIGTNFPYTFDAMEHLVNKGQLEIVAITIL